MASRAMGNATGETLLSLSALRSFPEEKYQNARANTALMKSSGQAGGENARNSPEKSIAFDFPAALS